jgi:hypothetical protein
LQGVPEAGVRAEGRRFLCGLPVCQLATLPTRADTNSETDANRSNANADARERLFRPDILRCKAGTFRQWGRLFCRDHEDPMIRKLGTGKYRLYSRKVNPKTGKRRNLGTFKSRAAAERHERDVQYFKRR